MYSPRIEKGSVMSLAPAGYYLEAGDGEEVQPLPNAWDRVYPQADVEPEDETDLAGQQPSADGDADLLQHLRSLFEDKATAGA